MATFRLGEIVKATVGRFAGQNVKIVAPNGQGDMYIQPANLVAGAAEDVVPESTLKKIKPTK